MLALLSLALPSGSEITVFLLIVLGGGALLYLLTRRARGALDRSSYDEYEVESDSPENE